MLYLYFCGLCMGAADLVPGISGGTIAFIMGFYYPLLESLKTINSQTGQLLLKGQLKPFFQQIAWKFLLPLGAGIASSFVLLSGFIHFILSHEIYRTYLYAFFTGLVVASTLFCFRQIREWRFSYVAMLLVGAVIAFLFTGPQVATVGMYTSIAFVDPWLILCGAMAISAMLLPGISGSYLLTLLGIYPAAIGALAHFISSLKAGHFDVVAFSLLLSLFIGIVGGLFSFARVVSWLLRGYPNATLSLLTGFMIGGIRSVWPFSAGMGTEMSIHSSLFCVGGFLLVIAVEALARMKNREEVAQE